MRAWVAGLLLSAVSVVGQEGPFFYSLKEAQAHEAADAIAQHFGVSGLLEGQLASKEASGTVAAVDLNGALETLGFLLGAE